MVIFAPGQFRACFNQTVVDDEEIEGTELFVIGIVMDPDITIGVPGATLINITDNDGGEILVEVL